MKIKQDYYFAFRRKKTTTKHHHTYLQQKRTHKVYFLVGETYIAKADANCIKVETQIFLDHPTGKNEHYFPFRVIWFKIGIFVKAPVPDDVSGILKITLNASNYIYRWSLVHNITHMYAKKGVL